MTTEERFWSHVDKRSDAECWEWKSARNKDGYGQFTIRVNGKKTVGYTNRLALKFSGVDIDGKWALHRCDNPPCCNPSHLYAGTHQDNVDDKLSRDRQPRGRECWAARLDEDKVRDIRIIYSTGECGMAELARLYGVSQPAIRKVINRVSWAHVA